MKKVGLQLLPYAASILAGFIFFIVGLNLSESIKDLFINIGATFFAIPFIYLFYQMSYNYSQKKLNKEIFDYGKMQVDIEITSIMDQLVKMICNSEESSSLKDLGDFFSLKTEDIELIVSNNKYIGFKIFKNWTIVENNLHEILKNPYILERLENEQIIAIIAIIRQLNNLRILQLKKDLYVDTKEICESYKIVAGKEISKENKHPERYFLLKNTESPKIGKPQFFVSDFGDFHSQDIEKLLKFFVLNKNYLTSYSKVVFHLTHEIYNWIILTGDELILNN